MSLSYVLILPNTFIYKHIFEYIVPLGSLLIGFPRVVNENSQRGDASRVDFNSSVFAISPSKLKPSIVAVLCHEIWHLDSCLAQRFRKPQPCGSVFVSCQVFWIPEPKSSWPSSSWWNVWGDLLQDSASSVVSSASFTQFASFSPFLGRVQKKHRVEEWA